MSKNICHNAPSIISPLVNEEKIMPQNWSGLVFCVLFSALTVIDG